MRLPAYREDWPESWKISWQYDSEETGSCPSKLGYRFAYQCRFDRTIRLVRSAASPPATILDVGAAQGTISLALAELGYDVTWNDFRADLAGYVQEKHTAGLIRYLPGNVLEQVQGTRYDVIVATEVIEHVAHPDVFLRHLATMLQSGGSIVLTTPNGDNFRNRLPRFSLQSDLSAFEGDQFKPDADGHIFLLYEGEIRAMAREAGLHVDSLELFQTHLAYGVELIAARGLRTARGRRLVELADDRAVRLPWVGPKLAVQLAARLMASV